MPYIVALACLVLAIAAPVAGVLLLGRFLFADADAEDRVDQRGIETGRLDSGFVWRHLQTWYKAKPRRLTFRK